MTSPLNDPFSPEYLRMHAEHLEKHGDEISPLAERYGQVLRLVAALADLEGDTLELLRDLVRFALLNRTLLVPLRVIGQLQVRDVEVLAQGKYLDPLSPCCVSIPEPTSLEISALLLRQEVLGPECLPDTSPERSDDGA